MAAGSWSCGPGSAQHLPGDRGGVVDPDLDPHDVYAMVIGLSLTWSPASPTVTAAAGDERRDHDRRRAGLAVAVRRAFRPG
ncbi:hypothetical protein [Pseudonocardia charpentierae]|uniref:HTH-type transcriptional repressor Sco4008 C-terminal domain-containing protein n=1 Tax=Pseudonocardia charpentierae TaxID=3075545 RepID=A0ABU2NGJ9_9PSEU|nr:hypothetical protein [Pseudonocardia sp. DSM 45834]MDT0352364.1 hypothetical protein [Pseudonocardia sp. DSM 45834]